MSISDTQKSYLISSLLFVPFVITLVTGLVLVFVFHMQHQHSELGLYLGISHSVWKEVHVYSSIISSIILFYHLRHIRRKIFGIGFIKRSINARKRASMLLLLFSLMCAITGFIPYIMGLFNSSNHINIMFVELHDKFGIILFGFALYHIIKKWKPTLKVMKVLVRK